MQRSGAWLGPGLRLPVGRLRGKLLWGEKGGPGRVSCSVWPCKAVQPPLPTSFGTRGQLWPHVLLRIIGSPLLFSFGPPWVTDLLALPPLLGLDCPQMPPVCARGWVTPAGESGEWRAVGTELWGVWVS